MSVEAVAVVVAVTCAILGSTLLASVVSGLFADRQGKRQAMLEAQRGEREAQRDERQALQARQEAIDRLRGEIFQAQDADYKWSLYADYKRLGGNGDVDRHMVAFEAARVKGATL